MFAFRLWRKWAKKGSERQKREVFHTFPPIPYYYYDFLIPYVYYLGGYKSAQSYVDSITYSADVKNDARGVVFMSWVYAQVGAWLPR